jgi:hypothetical protein
MLLVLRKYVMSLFPVLWDCRLENNTISLRYVAVVVVVVGLVVGADCLMTHVVAELVLG